MAVSSESPLAGQAANISTPSDHTANGAATKPAATAPSMPSLDTTTSATLQDSDDVDNTADFAGDVNTNNELPSPEKLRAVENMIVLDKNGKTLPFKSLYTGPNVARRVLVIFIRHFFCGYCQEYLRTLTENITEDSLLQLPTPTFIAIVGCGSPNLIPMYQEVTKCPFPIYSDPTKKLYAELGMIRTLTLGSRPEYQRRGIVTGVLQSVVQSLKTLKGGNAFKGGDYQQVGGEFLFEPVNAATPNWSPEIADADNESKQIGVHTNGGAAANGLGVGSGFDEAKRVTWCHRMKNTRDHAEIPELREVLGLDGVGVPGKDKKRWSKALGARKGTGLSNRTSMSMNQKMVMLNENGGASGRASSEKLMDSTNMVR